MKFSHWLALLSLLATGVLLWSLREIIILIFAGIVISIALCTLVNKLLKLQAMPRSLALIIVLSILFLIFSLVIAVVIPPFTKEFQELIIQLPKAARALWEIGIKSIDNIPDIVYGNSQDNRWDQKIILNEFTALPDGTTLANGVADGIKKLIDLAGNLGNGLIQLCFVLVIGIMISIQPNSYREVGIMLLPSFYRKRGRVIIELCGESISEWMTGMIISSFCVALLAGIGLSILGVKLVIANALLAGLLNIIPNLGPAISTIFPISVALLDTQWKALAVLGMYIFIQNLESYIITPSIMQQRVKLLPGLTLSAQFAFTIIFGPIGLLLALPLAVIIQVLIREIVIHDLLDNWKRKKLAL